MSSYAALFVAALAARGVLAMTTVSYTSPGQQAVWSWSFFLVFTACFAAAAWAAIRAGLPSPAATLAGPRQGWAWPVAVGAATGVAVIWSDVVSPAAAARGVETLHVQGWPAVPFYAYGAILITVVFHFLPIAIGSLLARHLAGWPRLILLAIVVTAVALSEDLRFFLGAAPHDSVETTRHVVSLAANAAEALFILRFGLLAGLIQRLTTYGLWHLAWPQVARFL